MHATHDPKHDHGQTHAHGHDHSHTHEHVCWGHSTHSPVHHRLEISNLKVSYREVLALEGINFATECGRSLALVGPNGAGKSTLLKSLAGLLKADSGRILWRGSPLVSSSHELAYLPQRGDVDWNFPITVRGLVEMGRYPNLGWWKKYSTHDEEIVERALAAMDLKDLEKRQISALSGGQQQRAFIARALAQEAHVLLLDEPFTGLDRPAQETLIRLFKELTREGRLLIASHHDLKSVPDIFDEVLVIKRKQFAFGPVKDVFSEKLIEETYSS
ncbi:ATP-binding cassette domain-containing protein [Verrucomicrobium sp. BvORR034]|uniref:metal ABC transporter ATP-binding protein n=1 Tax=Verrucomicrobium sp. BvORR034 TaxID=1396418 RepID=UPI000679ADB1|nr:ATP-binding cassette domain-containing protein [Verrucomicrobium sp. BvORR034]